MTTTHRIVQIQTNVIRNSWPIRNTAWGGSRERNPIRNVIRSAIAVMRLYR